MWLLSYLLSRTYSEAHTGVGGWTGLGAATHVAPQGLEGSTNWRTSYKVATSPTSSRKQGTASSSFMRSNTTIAKLTAGSNTPLTDSTNLQVQMQHRSGTALIWRDIPSRYTSWD